MVNPGVICELSIVETRREQPAMSTAPTNRTSSSQAPILETATQRFLDALSAQGGPPIYTLTYADARQVLENAQRGVTGLPADTEDRVFPVGPTGEVAVRIYRPKGTASQLPVVIYCHGGGWVLGSANTHDRLLRDMVNGTGAAFVFVSYTPSPEAQFPVPVQQAYAATMYVAEHGAELGLDSARLAIMGDSVGGNMATAVALMAKERGGPAIRYQALLYPVTDAGMDTGSYSEFAEGPWLTKPAMAWFWDAYAPNVADRDQPLASPLRSSVAGLRGMPPTLLVVDENDVLRDEGEAYARKLMQAGVEVTATRVIGTIHDFAMLNALAETQAAKTAIRLASDKLRAALQNYAT
jgi:acetyl esterase